MTEPSGQADLLALVAIAGMPVPVDVAAKALGTDAGTIISTGSRLVAEGHLSESPAGYSLVDGTRQDISPAAAAYLAGRAADAFAGTGADPEGVGRLLVAAGRSSQAWRVLADAFVAGGRHRSDQEQLRLGELALEALDQSRDDGGELEGRVRLQLGRLYRSVGRTVDAAAAIEGAVKRLTGEDLIDALAFAAAIADDRQHPQEAERWVALAELEAAGQGSLAKLGSVLTFHGRELSRLGFAAEAEAALAKGNSLLEAYGSEVQRFYGRLNQAWVDLDQGQMKRAEVGFARLRDEAEVREGEASKADKEAYWARALFGIGHPDDAVAAVERALILAETAGALAPRFIARLAEAEGALLFDRWEEALTAADQALKITLAHLPSWENVCRYLRARALASLGQRQEAREELELAMAATPQGSDGLRWRLRLEELQLELSDSWDQRRGEDLTDLLLQSRWLGAAVELMTSRSSREKDQELAAEAAALAMQIGNPMQAAKAIHAGNLWSDPAAVPVVAALRGVVAHLPEGWQPTLLTDPVVNQALEATTEVGEEDVALLRSRIQYAMETAGLSGEVVLSPAQRRAAGLVRRRPVRGRRTLRIIAAVVGVVAVGLISGAVVLSLARDPVTISQPTTSTAPPVTALEDNIIAPPELGLTGSFAVRGNAARSGSVSGGFGTATGRYWRLSPGGLFPADSEAVAYGRYLYVATTENRIYVIEQTGGRINHSISLEAGLNSPMAAAQPTGAGETADPLLVFATQDGYVDAYSALREGPRSWRQEIAGVTASPLIGGNFVYVASTNGYLYALDLGSGSIRWQYPAEGEPAGRFISAPALSNDTIYLADRDGKMYVIDALSGEPVCTAPIQMTDAVLASPLLADGVVFVQTESSSVHAIAAGDCGLRAAVEGYETVYPANSTGRFGPAVVGKLMFYVEQRQVLAMKLEAGVAAADKFQWTFEADDLLSTPPVVADGVVYVGSQSGTVFAVDADTGDELWRFSVGSPVRGEPVVVPGAVFVITASGEIWAIAGE